MSHPRRFYNTAWSRRRAEAQLEREQLRSQRCPRRAGSGKCGGIIETYIDTQGRTRVRCPLCERRKRGICRDCNAPVYGAVGKALRCGKHAHEARRRQMRASEERHREKRLEKNRAYYHRPDVRARRIEYKKAWRKANPDKVRAQKRRYVAKHAGDPNSAYNRFHRRYRRKFQEHKREMERDRLAAGGAMKAKAPKCTKCGRSTRWKPLHRGHSGKPWTICTPCLWPHQRKARLAARRRARRRAAEWLASIPKPARIKRPPQAPQYGPGKERLCLGGCGRVLTHRKKKCTRCKERDAQLAEHELGPSRGRGRRTDLERVA